MEVEQGTECLVGQERLLDPGQYHWGWLTKAPACPPERSEWPGEPNLLIRQLDWDTTDTYRIGIRLHLNGTTCVQTYTESTDSLNMRAGAQSFLNIPS